MSDPNPNGDQYPRWRGIDVWRAGAGRAEYNASRRKRVQPNDDLSSLSPEEKARRKRDQQVDAHWLQRQRLAGRSEPEIAGLYQKRLAKRAATARKQPENNS